MISKGNHQKNKITPVVRRSVHREPARDQTKEQRKEAAECRRAGRLGHGWKRDAAGEAAGREAGPCKGIRPAETPAYI